MKNLNALETIHRKPHKKRKFKNTVEYFDDVAIITTHRGFKIKVNKCDAEKVSEKCWFFSSSRKSCKILACCTPTNPRESIGRFILSPQKDEIVLYKDGDCFNNTRENLILKKMVSGGMRNFIKKRGGARNMREVASVVYRGVFKVDRPRNCWMASLDGKILGYYLTSESAAAAYDVALLERDGEDAKTNLGN